jgi:hypothetical protein
LVERRLVQPLLEVAEELDPRLPGIGHLALAMLHEMLLKATRGAFRWVWVSGAVAVLGVLAAVASSGWMRVLIAVLIALPAGGLTGFALGLRWSIEQTIHRSTGTFAQPHQRAAIRKALRQSRLPTSPFGLARMLVRTTLRGPRREVARIHAAARELAVELELDGPGTDPDAAPDDRS